ncbi:MAG: DUF937 domain-containing protein [Saprospiraceae bacterium]|nr:DUF937 domain-containing protein [Saprospiraceae bacterium]
MDLNDLFQSVMAGGLPGQLGQIAGVDDSQQAESAASTIFSTLMGAIQKNSSTPEGAEALNAALERDHDGSILDNLSGLLSGNAQPQNSNSTNGVGILGHLFGNKQGNVVNAVSQQTGLDASKIMNMMVIMAPIVMGMLGKAKNQTGADAGGLGNLIGSVMGGQAGSNPIMNILTGVLDKDGDGSFMDDVMGGGIGNLLGGLFGGKK